MADIRRGDALIEIQTTSFAAMGRKLDHLLGDHDMLIVHPIAVETYLHRYADEDRYRAAREGGDDKPVRAPRRSPKRNDLFALFDELVSMPTVLDHPNLAIEVALISVDKFQVADPTLRRRRGGWRTVDRRLREVVSRHRFESVSDLARLLPADLPSPFTTADLATSLGTTRTRGQRMAYCLRATNTIEAVERSRSGVRYRRVD